MFLPLESSPEFARTQEPIRQEGARVVNKASRPPRWQCAGVTIGMHEAVRLLLEDRSEQVAQAGKGECGGDAGRGA